MALPSKFTLQDLGMAYRKAKVDIYYAGNNERLKLLKYEQELNKNLEKLLFNLNQSSHSWIEKNDLFGEWTLIPKKIDCDLSQNKSNNFIHSDPQKEWNTSVECALKNNKNFIAEFRLMALPSIDFHILSTLWISKVGHKYDKCLKDCSYGNRLRYNQNKEINELSHGSFKPYLGPFRTWRDSGTKAMKESLEKGKKIVAITADVSSFYHKLNARFLLDDDYLDMLGIKLKKRDLFLTELLIEAIEKWVENSPLNNGLPVGLSASAIITNMALIELDRVIEREVKPIYYGRYVDDIMLVLESGTNFTSPKSVWEWLIERSKSGELEERILEIDEDRAILFTPSYLSNSEVRFENKKNKVFFLEGSTGKALVDSLARQINERASEWRALPDLPDFPNTIETDLVAAIREDGESVDTLRKADSLSMRRANFAITLRDFEAYERDLLPNVWEKQRKAFLNSFIKHVLVLPAFFDMAQYLPRVIQIATTCGDFYELEGIVTGIHDLRESLFENCKIELNSADNEQSFYSSLDYYSKWELGLNHLIEESITSAFPVNLSTKGAKEWNDITEGLKVTHFFSFETDIKIIQNRQKELFYHDLAHNPFREIGLPKELLTQRSLPSKDNIEYLQLENIFINSDVISGLEIISRYMGVTKKRNLPIGLVFSTRPFSLSELYFLHPEPYKEESIEEIHKAILALRGFTPKGDMPYKNKDNVLIVGSDKGSDSFNIAVTSWERKQDSWVASITNNPDPDKTRYQRLTSFCNKIMKSRIKPQYVIFPELSIPANWFIRISHKLHSSGIALISGVEYLHGNNNEVHNQVWVSLSHDGLGFPSQFIYRQDKQKAAIHEELELKRLADIELIPAESWYTPPIIQHGNFRFATVICSELTNIKSRAALVGKIDALFVPEWNKDTNYFNSMVESASLDIHAYIIQCNDRQYGDSRIRAPYKESYKRDIVRINGGEDDYFVIGNINVKELREFQSSHHSADMPFKPMPDGFEIDKSRKILPKGIL